MGAISTTSFFERMLRLLAGILLAAWACAVSVAPVQARNVIDEAHILVGPVQFEDPAAIYDIWLQGGFQPFNAYQKSLPKIRIDKRLYPTWLAILPTEPVLPGMVLTPNDIMHYSRLHLFVPVEKDGEITWKQVDDQMHRADAERPVTVISDFILKETPAAGLPILLRFDGRLSANVLLEWRDAEDAARDAVVRVLVSTACLAILLALGVYNLAFYVESRGRAYLLLMFYVLLAGFWLSRISGILHIIAPGFALWWVDHVTPNLEISAGSVLLLMISIRFLGLWGRYPLFVAVIVGAAVIHVIFGLLTVVPALEDSYDKIHRSQFMFAAGFGLVIVAINLRVLKDLQKDGMVFFTLSWVTQMVVPGLAIAGIRPVIMNVELPVSGLFLFGNVFVAIMLSFALGRRVTALDKQRLRLEEENIRDSLTGLFNQRHLLEHMENMRSDTRRKGAAPACVVLDVDHFKSFNDNYGHLAGDQVLRKLGSSIRRRLRAGDLAFRAGGEEFVLLFQNTDMTDIHNIVDQIRESFGRIEFKISRDGKSVRSSFSAGIAAALPEETGRSLMERADKALYQAKADGRNRIVLAK